MIRIEDAFRLARIKFKVRKGRAIFSAITVALGVTVLLTMIIALGGLLSFGKQAFKDNLAEKYFVSISILNYCYDSAPLSSEETDAIDEGVTLTGECEQQTRWEDTVKGEEDFDFKSVTSEKSVLAYYYSLPGMKASKLLDYVGMGGVMLKTTNTELVRDYIYTGYSFDDEYDGKIPVLVPEELLDPESAVDSFTGAGLSAKQIVENRQELLDRYLGKTYELEEAASGHSSGDYETNILDLVNGSNGYKKTGVEVVIVGIVPNMLSGSGFLIGMSNMSSYGSLDLVVPLWATEENDYLRSRFSEVPESQYYLEFNTREERDAFAEINDVNIGGMLFSGGEYSMVTVMRSRYEMFADAIKIFQQIGLVIGGFLLLVSAGFISSTVAKLASDSKKEIGVFRSFGAQKSDIVSIFFAYVVILVSAGFALGLLLSLGICVWLSLTYGESVFYSMIIWGTMSDLTKPILLFVGFPVLQVLAVYGIGVAVGFLASLVPILRAAHQDPIKALRDE